MWPSAKRHQLQFLMNVKSVVNEALRCYRDARQHPSIFLFQMPTEILIQHHDVSQPN